MIQESKLDLIEAADRLENRAKAEALKWAAEEAACLRRLIISEVEQSVIRRQSIDLVALFESKAAYFEELANND